MTKTCTLENKGTVVLQRKLEKPREQIQVDMIKIIVNITHFKLGLNSSERNDLLLLCFQNVVT